MDPWPNSLYSHLKMEKNQKEIVFISSYFRCVDDEGDLLFINLPHPSGHVFGMGSASVLTATPYATDSESNPLYGVSPVNNSHDSTP